VAVADRLAKRGKRHRRAHRNNLTGQHTLEVSPPGRIALGSNGLDRAKMAAGTRRLHALEFRIASSCSAAACQLLDGPIRGPITAIDTAWASDPVMCRQRGTNSIDLS
jgi:hypothetical protein